MAYDQQLADAQAEADRLRADLERVTGERSRAAVAASIASEYTVTLEAKIATLTAQRDAARGDLSALIGMTPPDQGMLTAWLCPECWYLDDRPPKEDKCHPKPGTTLAVCDVTMHRIAWAAAGAKMLKELKAARAALAATKPEGGAE